MATRLLCLVLLLRSAATAQEKDGLDSGRRLSLTPTFQSTSIWTERGVLQPFTRDHPWSLALDAGWLSNSQRAWNSCGCYTQSGLSLGYFNFANPAKLGHAVTLSAFTAPYLRVSKRMIVSLRGSAGLAFLDRVYDSVRNRENIFFSTPMSFYLALGLAADYRLSSKWSLYGAAQFNHISNGGRRDPNEGMNFPGWGVGVRYTAKGEGLTPRVTAPFTDRGWTIIAQLFGNQRTVQATPSLPMEQRPLVGLNVGMVRRLGRINSIGPGGEWYFDGINAAIQQRGGPVLSPGTAAVNLQHYLYLGKLLFGQQVAWFVTSNTGYTRRFFQQYVLQYEVSRGWYAGVLLKAHGDHSDFLAFALGRSFMVRR